MTASAGGSAPARGPGQRTQEEGSPHPPPAQREPRPAKAPLGSPGDPRAELRRRPERARYEREAVHAILDEGLVAHVGLVVDGQPFVIPMAYGRNGDELLLHGSVASRLQRRLAAGVPACVTVTLLDGLVLARSQFHHSMNYRSVVVFGTATRLTDDGAARRALAHIVDHIVPGRTDEARPPSPAELRQTSVLSLPIEAASVKVRSGPPIEDEDDLGSSPWAGVWAGTVPVTTVFCAPAPDSGTGPGVTRPASLTPYRRPGTAGN